MNIIVKVFLFMSFSGALLILFLFLGKQLLKNKISRQWQYYIWLIVILRLLLPFGFTISLPEQQIPSKVTENSYSPAASLEQPSLKMDNHIEDLPTYHPLKDITPLLTYYIWLPWFVVMVGMFIRKITIYQNFICYINAGSTPVSSIKLLDQLSILATQMGIKKPIELYINPLISSPLLIGFFHPCILLPSTDIPEENFQYIILHELTHYKRLDMFYKWLVQITVCLHWFNPFVFLMGREITKACEFSCDEAVLTKIGYNKAQAYGNTLLDAMASAGKYKESFGTVTLNENKKLLKERLGAIMSFKKKSIATQLLTGIMTLFIFFGASLIGIDSANASNSISTIPENPTPTTTISSSEISQYYEAGSLPLFQIAFSRLDAEAKRTWLDTIYTDKDIMFFSICINQLQTDDSLFQYYAEKTYTDNMFSFFSVLANHMDKNTLKIWLDRSLEDKKWSFQSILFGKLDSYNDWDDKLDALEEQLAAKQIEEYQTYGIIKQGEDYYYQDQLINIFLDPQPYIHTSTLNINPAGTVNIKVIRGENNQITGITYMSDMEVIELFDNKKTIIEMELDKNYSYSDPFVNARLFCASDNIDVLYAELCFELDGESGIVEIKDRETDKILWSYIAENTDNHTFTIKLDQIQKEKDYVIQFTGTKINYAAIKVTFESDLIQEKARPSK